MKCLVLLQSLCVQFLLYKSFTTIVSAQGTEDFFPYGEGTGDTIVTSDSRHSLSTPFVFYTVPHTLVEINSNGVISFTNSLNGRPYSDGSGTTVPSNNVVGDIPFIAPLWSNYNLNSKGGNISFRATSDGVLIARAVGVLSENNTELGSYEPELLFIVTWSDAAADKFPEVTVTFQVILVTDGLHSFTILLYGSVHPDAQYLVGFNAGDRVTGLVVTTSEQTTTSLRDAVFRVDGSCVSLASSSCSLLSFATACTASGLPDAVSCNCSSGYMNVTGTCLDINECAAPSGVCPEGSTCLNTIGNFRCPCLDGYYGDDKTLCIDIDECEVNIGDCDPTNAVCNNTIGGFNCTCLSGFLGDGRTCIEQVSAVTCIEGMSPDCVCDDVTSLCYCARGFTSGSEIGTCEDMDECSDDDALCTQECINTVGSHLCTCYRGYYLEADGSTCADIDECVTGLSDCGINAVCTNMNGSFSCACEAGFNGNGRDCFTADVCSVGTHSCQQICVSVGVVSFQCLCYPGFMLGVDGLSCDDLDECATGLGNCHAMGMCENKNGSFLCTCGSGFYGDGVTCIDIDECFTGIDNCDRINCTNTVGSFECGCSEQDGFFESPDGMECLRATVPDIVISPVNRPIDSLLYSVGNDFCLEGPDDLLVNITFYCNPIDIIPSHILIWMLDLGVMVGRLPLPNPALAPGALVDGNILMLVSAPLSAFPTVSVICRVINPAINDFHDEQTFISRCAPNECQDGITNNCTTDCMRNDSTYTCLCNQGNELASDNVSCVDIDECAPVDPMHDCNLNSTDCVNLIGSFRCDCRQGYADLNSTTNSCEDIDECDSDQEEACSQECTNEPGSFSCSCYHGYDLDQDNITCIDQDECLSMDENNCTDIIEICNNTIGGFTCQCSQGYRQGEISCEDVDECLSNPCPQSCMNLPGSYMCSCLEGYLLSSDDNVTCNDIDECLQPKICGSQSNCENTNGSYTCTCGQLYTMTDSGCRISSTITAYIASGLSVFIAVVVVIVIVVTLIIIRNGLRKKYHLEKAYSNEYILAGSRSTPPPPANAMGNTVNAMGNIELAGLPRTLRIPIKDLTDTKVIGEGEFGTVYKAKYFNELVAVKTLKGFSIDDASVNSLIQEILKMKKFSHVNVLGLKGVAIDAHNYPCIVLPYMANGSVLEYLRRENVRKEIAFLNVKDSDFKVVQAAQKLMGMCLQIGKGMEYLSSKKVIHRDLAARNCMMDANNVIKVADFGLSVAIAEDKNYFKPSGGMEEKLPVKWMAPESLQLRRFSEMSDVWSYGVTCWEVLSGGQVPYGSLKATEILREVENRLVLERPKNQACTEKMYSIMQSCWEFEAKDRPTFKYLVRDLSDHLQEFSDYLPLSLPLSDQITNSSSCDPLLDDRSVSHDDGSTCTSHEDTSVSHDALVVDNGHAIIIENNNIAVDLEPNRNRLRSNDAQEPDIIDVSESDVI